MGKTKPAIAPLSVKKLLDEGLRGRVKADAIREAATPDAYRAGNAGAIIDGVVYADCPRLAHLRYLGFQQPSSPNDQIMFAAGRAMEQILLDLMEHSSVPPERIKRESEAPVKYEHESGKTITGRPDFIILNEDGTYNTGIECKGKMSYWGARNLLVEGKADTSHLIQAAHYMWKHGLAGYALVYVVPVKYPISAKEKEQFSHLPDSMVEYREGVGPINILPNYYVIDLSTSSDGTLVVDINGVTHRTKLRLEHIQAFYSAADNMGSGKPLPAPPSTKSLFGKAGWKKCSYCKLRNVCDSTTDYEEWLDKSVDTITENWSVQYPELLPLYLNNWED